MKTARAALESNVQLLTASESALRGEEAQLPRRVEELGDEVAKVCQEQDCKV